MKPTIKIAVVSDVVCPWCYIGKRRLDSAIKNLSAEYDFDIEYRPFELNPQMPGKGVDQKKYLTNKFGSEDRYKEITNHVKQVGAAEGIEFNFEKQNVSPNTRKAHGLIELAKKEGNQLELVEALFEAYFNRGIDLSKEENLVEVAMDAGLDKARVLEHLKDKNVPNQVALEEQQMYKLGITGVPFYIINNRYGISGAQPVDTFIQAFHQVVNVPIITGEVCDIDGKNC